MKQNKILRSVMLVTPILVAAVSEYFSKKEEQHQSETIANLQLRVNELEKSKEA